MPGIINLNDVGGPIGFQIEGLPTVTGGNFGFALSGGGDINGDGIDDFLVGAPRFTVDEQFRSGQSYVVFGDTNGFPDNFDLNTLDGTNGFGISGSSANEYTGFSISAVGDINGDGYDDVLIGAERGSPDGRTLAGESYVVFGSGDGFPADVNLGSLDGSNGFTILGRFPEDEAVMMVSAAGDVNGDGIDDIVIGQAAVDIDQATVQNNEGEAYIIFGSADGFDAQIDLRDINGSNGFAFQGINAGDVVGGSVSSAGDLNGDGFDDVVIGATGVGEWTGNGNPGAAYVIFGTDQGLPASLNANDLNGSNGFTIVSSQFTRVGSSVSAAGDVNGDGVDDIIVETGRGGANFVVYGSSSGFASNIDLSNLSGTSGFLLSAAARNATGVGDVNGDGIDDLAFESVSDWQVAVVFGSADGFSGPIDLAALDGEDGFIVNLPDTLLQSGIEISGTGDIDGDGLDDILLGDPGFGSDAGSFGQGAAYILFGDANIGQVARLTGSDANDSLDGGEFADTLAGAGGDDRLRGFDGADRLLGGRGNDTVWAGTGDTGNDVVIGGTGDDLLAGGAGNDLLVGGDADAFGLPATSIAENEGADVIFGGAGNDTLVGASWRDANDNGTYDDGEAVTVGLQSNTLFAGSGDDRVVGGDGSDQLGGGTGQDHIEGRGGNDTVWGGADAGADTVVGGAGDDILFGGGGGDNLSGDVGNDVLFGGASGDGLEGGSGADSLYGGAGDDTLTGGSQEDTFFFANSHGIDVVTDFEPGDDILYFVNTVTDFTDLASVQSAASETTLNGQSGLLIDTGGGNSIFLVGIVSADLTEDALVL